MKPLFLLFSLGLSVIQIYHAQNETMFPCFQSRDCSGNPSACSSCTTCQDNSCQTCQAYKNRFVPLGCNTCATCPNINTCGTSECNRLSDYCPSCPKSNCTAICNPPHTIFIPRSQGANTARELVGWQEYIWRYTPGCNYYTTAHTFEYQRSFRPERIARYLFGATTLSFAGSQVEDRTACAITADYFGMSPELTARVRFSPIIENYIFDNQFFFGLDAWCQGSWIQINAPIVHTRWNLRPCVSELDTGNCEQFPPCYMSGFKSDATCNPLQALNGTFTFGDIHETWQGSRISPCALTKNGLADIDFLFGYNYYQCPNYHFGPFLMVVAPTGSKPRPGYLFSPIVGNGKHWELGGGLCGHLELWNYGPDFRLLGYFIGNVTHLFANHQCRTFDFSSNGPLSRYLLLKEFEQTSGGLEYTGNIINGVNFTTRPVKVSVPVKGEVSLKLAFRSPCWAVDLGYNFYGNTSEHLTLCSQGCDETFYGIKGTSGTCALEYETTNTVPSMFGPLVRKDSLNATESDSTICTPGTIDNEVDVQTLSPSNIAVTAFSRQTGPVVGPDVIIAKNSASPVLVSTDDLNLCTGTAAATATHKIFAHINYSFLNYCNWCSEPYVGIGGEFEVDAFSCNEQTSLNQWGVWIKGGLAF